MDAGNGALLSLMTVLVALIALAMIVQAIAVLVFVLAARKQASRLITIIEQINHDAQPILQNLREAIAEGREKVNVISKNVLEISEAVKQQLSVIKGQIARVDGVLTDVSDRTRAQVGRLDAILADASERARMQFIRLDDLVTGTMSRIEDTGEMVRRSVMTPVREISAILSGVRTTFDFLFRRNRSGVDHATQDEELFI